jgi:phenylacetate-coenzyme A ligase PaaK-like adenylate-forming protein
MSLHFKISKYLLPYQILQFKRKWEALQYNDPEYVAQYQLERIRKVIKHCQEHVPYYRDLFQQNDIHPQDIQSLHDLQKIPELSKDILREQQERMVSEKGWHFLREQLLTSGTTGDKISIWVNPVARAQEFVRYWLFFQRGGYRIGKSFAEFSSDFFMDQEDPLQVLSQKNSITNQLLLNTSYLCPENVCEYLELMRRNKVRFIKSRPSSLYLFSQYIQEQGACDLGLECVFTIGEPLHVHQREAIERTFGCRILDFYGHMERVVALSECTYGRMHVDEGYGLVEFQDVSGVDSGADGGKKSRLLGTTMHNLLMPFIRYDTGDLVEPDADAKACPCGNTSRIVKRIYGRTEDVITSEEGAVYPALFLIFNMISGIRMGQIIQADLVTFRVNIYPDSDLFDDAQNEELLFHLRKYLGQNSKIDIRVVEVKDFEYGSSGKFRSVISSVKSSWQESGV